MTAIYTPQKLIVDRYGDDAPIEATMRTDSSMAQRNKEGHAALLRIKAAAEEIPPIG